MRGVGGERPVGHKGRTLELFFFFFWKETKYASGGDFFQGRRGGGKEDGWMEGRKLGTVCVAGFEGYQESIGRIEHKAKKRR